MACARIDVDVSCAVAPCAGAGESPDRRQRRGVDLAAIEVEVERAALTDGRVASTSRSTQPLVAMANRRPCSSASRLIIASGGRGIARPGHARASQSCDHPSGPAPSTGRPPCASAHRRAYSSQAISPAAPLRRQTPATRPRSGQAPPRHAAVHREPMRLKDVIALPQISLSPWLRKSWDRSEPSMARRIAATPRSARIAARRRGRSGDRCRSASRVPWVSARLPTRCRATSITRAAR